MGMIICATHGQQLMAFTSPLIARAIEDPKATRSINSFYRISIPFLGVVGHYLLDAAFVQENGLPFPVELDAKTEVLAENVFEKLMPVCKQCLDDLYRSSSSAPTSKQ